MEHVRWSSRPSLRRPVLLAAFEGWSDAGDAATTTARYLRDRWGAELFASLDPEDFYDFSSTRPQVRLDDDLEREIVWPSNEWYAATVPGADLDAIVLLGTEPQLRWRTFCRQITDVAAELNVGMVVTLGALLAEVPHSRPVSVIGTAADDDLITRLNLRRSTYEGPTGITGVLHDACRVAGLPSASLWAAVPAYVPGAPSPKAALALLERTSELLEVTVAATDLEIASAAYERQVNELVSADDDMAGYVSNLEERFDDEDDPDEIEIPSGDELMREVESFLRDQGE